MNPLGFSPALLRGGDGRLGRSLDPILLYYQSYHSWTIVSVTAVTFTARPAHSRAADPDTLHFQGSPRLEQGLDGDPHLASCGSPVYRYRAYQIQSPLPPTPATLLGADDIWMTAHNGVDPPRSNPTPTRTTTSLHVPGHTHRTTVGQELNRLAPGSLLSSSSSYGRAGAAGTDGSAESGR